MKLKAGQQAPLFQATDIYGRQVALAQYFGQKLLLSFYRAAVCPLCNLHTWHTINRYVQYQRQGLWVIAFYESSTEHAHHYLDRLQAPFPVIADLERRVYDLYGLDSSFLGAVYARLFRPGDYRAAAQHHIGGNVVENLLHMDGKFGRLPAEFLVDSDLRIRRAHYGRDAGDFLLFSEIDAFAASR
jgi:thioredoxin-dependent peroxiredoxin